MRPNTSPGPRASAASKVRAPRAEIRNKTTHVHNVALQDDYDWLQAPNWKEVLRDPQALPADIRHCEEVRSAYPHAPHVSSPRFSRAGSIA